jgi:hypothetical protein
MANIAPVPTFFPRRLSEYVPAMQYCADVANGGGVRISFGAPALAVAAGILSAQSIAVAGSVQAASLLSSTLDAPYGRNLTYVASGASTATITVDGWDYLNQPMSEQVTLNGATPVVGKKCFKYLRQITNTVTAATTINVGPGATVGLPYKALSVYAETTDSALAAAGTLIAADLTDPATATTGEPRGAYTSTTAFNGAKVITATFEFDNDVNAAGNGGLHGIVHFAN